MERRGHCGSRGKRTQGSEHAATDVVADNQGRVPSSLGRQFAGRDPSFAPPTAR
jgi:hypothetical protein